jgi:hypothetical protein
MYAPDGEVDVEEWKFTATRGGGIAAFVRRDLPSRR